MNEHRRHVKARQDIMKGGTAEKRIIVHMEDLEEKKKREKEIRAERERRNDRMDALKEAKTPWFCPECKKVMKKKLDDKMWGLFGHCFDCQIKIENKLRIEGKYEEWAENKIRKNKIGFVKDQMQAIEEWKDTKAPEWFNNVGVNTPELEKEKWDVDIKKVKKEAKEALQKYNKVLKQLESEV